MAITINGNGITSANIADGAITLADLDSSISFSSSNLSSDFTVAAGKTVTAGTFANLYGGEIGNNPVANTLGAEQSYSAETANYITGDGKYIVKGYSNSSGHHCIKSYNVSDMSVVSDVAGYTGLTSAGTNIRQISDNRFAIYASYKENVGNVSASCGSSHWGSIAGGRGWIYIYLAEVAADGTITTGSTYTWNTGSYYYHQTSSNISIQLLDDGRAGVKYGGQKGINSCNTYYNYYKTFPTTGGLNISSIWQDTDSFLTSLNNSIVNTAGTKIVQPSTATSWNIANWDGVDVSSGTTITNNRTNLSSAQFIKPDPNQDKLLCFYINSNLELCVETLDWTASAINVVANSKAIIEADASGVSLGSIKGSTAGVGITYENGSKGRFKTLSLDSNMVVTGQSSVITVNDSNVVPGLAYKGNDVFQVWNNNVDTYTRSVTINAYSTSPLKPLGVINANGSGGNSVSVTTRGVASGFTGLTPDTNYYYDTSTYDGTVTTTNTGVFVGRAVSSTEILLTDLTEQ